MANDGIWTIQKLLRWTTDYFQKHGLESPRLDAELLLAHVLGKPRIHLYTEFEQIMNRDELTLFKTLIQKRIAGTCTAVLIGEKSFMGLSFSVNEHVLVPRADTETWLEKVIQYHRNDRTLRVGDLGTGSGAVLLSFLYYCKYAVGVGVDISSAALEVAKANGVALGLAQRTEWRQGNYIDILEDDIFDGILSNPPYIPTKDLPTLSPEVRQEPILALDGGDDGLDFYRLLAKRISPHIRSGGFLAVEVGMGQADAVTALLEETGDFDDFERIRDYGGIERALYGRKKVVV